MKHALSAAVALALGIGLAATAQAHGTYDRNSAISGTDMQAGGSATRPAAATRHHTSRQQVMHTQRMLQARGFYHGRIDGMMNRQTRMAMVRFQKQQQAPHRMLAAHKAHRPAAAVGVGSSRPNDRNAMSGSSNNITPTPATPAPNAGSDQNR